MQQNACVVKSVTPEQDVEFIMCTVLWELLELTAEDVTSDKFAVQHAASDNRPRTHSSQD